MDTTVTGLFLTPAQAARASSRLLEGGFRTDQIRVVTRETPDRDAEIDRRTADTKRAVVLGVAFGPLAGGLAGAALSGTFELVPAMLVGAAVGVVGGAVLGLLVGRATTTQVQDEVKHEVDAGAVLLTVTTDRAQAQTALELMEKEGGTNLVATAASYTGGVLPIAPPPAVVEARRPEREGVRGTGA